MPETILVQNPDDSVTMATNTNTADRVTAQELEDERARLLARVSELDERIILYAEAEQQLQSQIRDPYIGLMSQNPIVNHINQIRQSTPGRPERGLVFANTRMARYSRLDDDHRREQTELLRGVDAIDRETNRLFPRDAQPLVAERLPSLNLFRAGIDNLSA